MRSYVAAHGEAPSLWEIAADVGLSSPSNVLYQLERLEGLRTVQRREQARRRGLASVLT
ncbi:hypothetical protein ABZ070_35795 [Streptomyces sp. NPDC006283]|uniref:LexA family protein n=1 Tax=Streptomyces sp. NPDC006283 TaxID=3156741 RepID=UPI0033BB6A76